MLAYIARRFVIMIPMLVLLSIIAFVIIQLPPGDYLTTYINARIAAGETFNKAEIDALRAQYGLDQSIYVQYARWMGDILFRGSFGTSFFWGRPVGDLLVERLPITIFVSLSSLIVVYTLAIPIAIISAIYKYSWFDFLATTFGFIGLATPNFLIALALSWIFFLITGGMVTSLFSLEFRDAPWSFAKFLDLMSNVWLPILIIGLSGTAGLIRTLRATLLDELSRPYVVTARSKGLTETKLLLKYPVRIAMNPVFSTIGWLLPGLINGGVIVGIVLNLQMIGPVLMQATLTQDMYLAGSIVLILGVLTVIGTLISDILLAWLDPRIRYGAEG
ncbi:MAG: ABC transporter permease [Anaerolineae bacterium]|jgi:peptide/nickel transport system permease protein|nr:ABC transporter permease [Anaerolineae bacterium]